MVTQLGECKTEDLEVAGSSPAHGTILIPLKLELKSLYYAFSHQCCDSIRYRIPEKRIVCAVSDGFGLILGIGRSSYFPSIRACTEGPYPRSTSDRY